ncbi:MAG: IS5 family transposase [Parachlamydiales bacterium]
MGKRNWRQYNQELVNRGSLTFLVDPEVVHPKLKRERRSGRPLEFSDQLILMLMLMKVHYRLTYRMLEGFVRSLQALAKAPFAVPTYSLICKRAASLNDSLPDLSNRRPSIVILDASGLKILGEGEWKVRTHGKGKRRKWLKIHVAIDARTLEIVAEMTTVSTVADDRMTGCAATIIFAG